MKIVGLLLILFWLDVYFCMHKNSTLSKTQAFFPSQFYAILSVYDNSTGSTYYSGRVWYDVENQRKRMDIKIAKSLVERIWLYDENVKYEITEDKFTWTCQKHLLNGKLHKMFDVSTFEYQGTAKRWGSQCDHFKVLNETDKNYFDYYQLTSSKMPFEIVTTGKPALRYNWTFFKAGVISFLTYLSFVIQ